MARATKSGKPVRRWQLRKDPTGSARSGAGRRALRRSRKGLLAVAPYALVAGVVVVASVAVWVLLGSTLLGVRTINVHGEKTISSEQVARAAAIPVGTPLARLDTASAASRVAALAPVASVEVQRSWPNSVVVTVVERTPVAVVASGKNFRLLDAKGTAYRTVATRPAGLPLVKLGKVGPKDPSTLGALRVAESLTPELRERLIQIVATSPQRIQLQLLKNRLVFWGAADDSVRKAKVATALLGESGKRIDVSASDVATVR